MVLSDEKKLALQSLLSILPGREAFRLAKVIEIDQLHGGGLPHTMLLDYLRPALRNYGVRQRTPSPLRSFCMPFEDLLFSGPRRQKQKGMICRSAILPLWNWLGRDVQPDAQAEYIRDFKTLADQEDFAGCETLATAYRERAASAVAVALAEDPEKAEAYFNNDFIFADVSDMVTVLDGSTYAMAVRALFIPPSPAPDDGRLSRFRRIFDTAEENHSRVAPYLPVVAMGRLEKPWHAIRLVRYVTYQHRETKLAQTDVGLTGDVLLARMENAMADIYGQSRTLPDFDPEILLDRLTTFTLLSNAITREVDILRSGQWGQRLLSNRSAISSIMEGYMDRAFKQISGAIPMKSMSYGPDTMVPKFAREVSDAQASCASHYAQLLAGCQYLASAAAFGVKYSEVLSAVTGMLCFYNDALLRELKNRSWPNEAQVHRQFSIAVDLTRFLLGNEEAALLQRRGMLARKPF